MANSRGDADAAGDAAGRSQNGVDDREASHQTSSNQNVEQFTIMGIVSFVPKMESEAALRTTTLGGTTLHGQYFDPSLATGAAGLATQSISVNHPGEDEHYPEEAYSHTVWLADDNVEVSILMCPALVQDAPGTPQCKPVSIHQSSPG